jgi:hypothetical protein
MTAIKSPNQSKGSLFRQAFAIPSDRDEPADGHRHEARALGGKHAIDEPRCLMA